MCCLVRRPVDDGDEVSTGGQVHHSEREPPAPRHRAAKAHKNERLRRQFQARKSLAGAHELTYEVLPYGELGGQQWTRFFG